ncbi:sialate O-acetylesterase [Chitinophaga sp. YR627]|uniref:sialate O-acetylesterase n=1 Tax=Chitinophaga sp. YR627 TaxID=1881041 RepID=UPI0008F077E6|nr:sialate O-acetylesterase [Chitinophaga sp. YR627]SFM72497.1 sialate O-acetylesterase [Chitinophaga sp. YR627]
MTRHRYIIAGALLFSLLHTRSVAQVRLPRLVGDSMVLQRDTPVQLWGWASPHEKIRITFRGKQIRSTSGPDGKWSVTLPPMSQGGPFTMDIRAKNHIVLREILVGDVWLCAGQSNMEHQLRLHSERYAFDITNANFPEIRHFKVPPAANLKAPSEDVSAAYWKSATPTNVADFSAVAYFFARDLYQRYHVPVGLINASVGGTPIEAWTSKEGLKDFPAIQATIRSNETITPPPAPAVPELADAGLDSHPTWYDPSYTPQHWRPFTLPGYWNDQGVRELNGIVWFRREIEIPATMTDKSAMLRLGRIVDADVVYVNGQKVGNTTYQYPQRRYTLPAGILKPGKNLIVVRVTNNAGKGGFIPDKPYYIATVSDTVDIKGEWQYKVGAVYQTPPPQITFRETNCPTALHNGMLAPVIPYTIKGALWYQGESNMGNPQEYSQLLPALINDWRNKWQNPALPVLFVQLPGFLEVQYLPSESNWATLRESQRKSITMPHTGMAIAIDLGEWNDVHPDSKKEVGDRLALLARKMVYGEGQLVASGPLVEKASLKDNKVVVSFTNTGSGLITNDGNTPGQFAIAGKDGKFVWAQTKLEGNTVIVWSPAITAPVRVRYAWADNPDNPNLYNREGLPASPFELNIDL